MRTLCASLKLNLLTLFPDLAFNLMEKVFNGFAKLSACIAVMVGAPLVIVSAVSFTVNEWNEYVDFKNCEHFAKLDQVVRDCK